MKKLLSLSLIIVIILSLFACGQDPNQEDGSQDDTTNHSSSHAIILPSSLISVDEAMDLLGMELRVYELDEEVPGGQLKCVYDSDDVMFQVVITQDALMTGLNLEYGGAENTFNKLIAFQKEDSPDFIFEVDGVGEEAYLLDLAETDRWSLHILQSGYLIALFLNGGGDNDWIFEKLEESGKLAVKNLLKQI